LVEGEQVVTPCTFLVDSESCLKSLAQAPPAQDTDQRHNIQVNSPAKLGLAAITNKFKDAACGMMVDRAKAVIEDNTVAPDRITYYFCSERCAKNFGEQEEHYLALDPLGHRP
jgi:YHS domain-containing protein